MLLKMRRTKKTIHPDKKTPRLFIGWVCLCAETIYIVIAHFSIDVLICNIGNSMRSIRILSIITIPLIVFFSSAFHEFGHLLMAKMQSRTIAKCGVRRKFIFFSFYIDLANESNSKITSASNIQILLAGPLNNLLVSAATIQIAKSACPSNINLQFLMLVYSINSISAVINLLPASIPVKLDGYQVLKEIRSIIKR